MEDAKVKSLARAMKVLECFTVEAPELGVTELSEMLGFYKSNVHNILSTFELYGYIERVEETQKYRLGMKILELAHVVNSDLGIHKIIAPIINELANEVGEVVYFGIPMEGQVIYIDGAYPTAFFGVRSMMGEKAEMYCTGIGKAMLAYMKPNALERALKLQSYFQHTENTIRTEERLLIELKQIKLRGFSIDEMEHEFGIRCVAVPVFDRFGELVGAMSISGPSPRITNEVVVAYSKKLQEHAHKISLRLH